MNNYKIETILNNRPLTYYYADENEPCLTPNHMPYGRTLKVCDPETSFDVSKMLLLSKINNIVNHFRNRWKKEYLVIRKLNIQININK